MDVNIHTCYSNMLYIYYVSTCRHVYMKDCMFVLARTTDTLYIYIYNMYIILHKYKHYAICSLERFWKIRRQVVDHIEVARGYGSPGEALGKTFR